MFEPRARVPHFVVRTVDEAEVDYRTIWQKEQLLLVSLDDSEASRPLGVLAGALFGREGDLAATQSRLVVTRDVVPGLPRPGVVVADRWGEIHATLDASSLKDADDLIEWLRFVQRKCS